MIGINWEDGENVIQATLGVNQAQPWHEGKYKCNTLHPNYHYLRVVVNSGGKREDLHRHHRHEHARTTPMVVEIDVVASQLTSSRPATTQDLDTGDGTTNEIGNDDADSQIDAGTSTIAGMDERGMSLDDDEDGGKVEVEFVDMDVERVNNGDDDDLVVDGGKIEMENVHANELGTTVVSETTLGVTVNGGNIEELSTTSPTTDGIIHGSANDVIGHNGKMTGMDLNGVKMSWETDGGTRGIHKDEKDKQLEKIVMSKGERLIIIKGTSCTQGDLQNNIEYIFILQNFP